MYKNKRSLKNYKNLLVAIFIFVFPFAAESQNIGRAPYALQSKNFNCSSLISSLKNNNEVHISFLYNTFGASFSCPSRILSMQNFKSVQIHLINETCSRNGRVCGRYEFVKRYRTIKGYKRQWKRMSKKFLRRYEKYASRVSEFLTNNLPEGGECLISPGLESNLSGIPAKNMIQKTRELFPMCRIVWNPVRPPRGLLGADLREHHGVRKPRPFLVEPCVANNDGVDVDMPFRKSPLSNSVSIKQMRKLIKRASSKNCEFVYLWASEDNCILSSKFIDPRRRRCDGRNRHSKVLSRLIP